MTKHQRKAIQALTEEARSHGLVVELSAKRMGTTHCRVNIFKGGRCVGYLTMSSSPRDPDNAVNNACQELRRFMKGIAA